MTAVKPQVLVYQELATTSGESPTPILNSLIAGPCYHLRDYPADRSLIALPAYGTRTGDNSASSLLGVAEIPATGDDALVVASPPDNAVGAMLDHASVAIYMENALAIITKGSGAGVGAAPDENLVTVAGETFAAKGVRPGDRIVLTDPAGPTSVLKVVAEVGGFGGSTLLATQLRLQSNYTAAGTDINGDAYTGAATTSLLYRVERALADGEELSSSYYTLSGNSLTVLGGALVLQDFDGDLTSASYTLSYAELYMEYRSLRQDLADVQVITSANIDTLLGRKDTRNPLHVGATLALSNSGSVRVQAFGVTGDNLNGASDLSTAYGTMLGLLASRSDIHAITPLTHDSTVIGLVKDHCNTYSAPEKSKFRVCIAGWGPLATERTIGTPGTTGTSESVAADTVSVLTSTAFNLVEDTVRAGDVITICNDAAGVSRLGSYTISRVFDAKRLASSDLAGTTADTEAIKFWIFRGSTGTVSRRLTAVSLTDTQSTFAVPASTGTDADIGRVARLVGAAPGNATGSPNSSAEYLIISRSTDTYTVEGTFGATESVTVDIVDTLDSAVAAIDATNRKAFRRLLDNSATFVTNGATAGSTLEVPIPAGVSLATFDSVYSGVIDSVDSENRVTLVAGEDIPTMDPAASQATIGYRIRKSLSIPDQAANLTNIVDGVGSFEERRLVLVWPDEALLAGILNAKTGVQGREPGYYLAAAVAGMCAGVPPHQGLTRRPLNGVTTLYNSTRYFSEEDLELISNSGFYLLVQETDTSLPYSLHQLTTDTSSVNAQELSIVRSLDYISKFLKDLVETYIGQYNVNAQTLELIAETVRNGIEQLRSDVRPKIGAVLIDGTLTSISVLAGASDRVELFLDLDIPGPLNRIGLHLIV